MKVVVSKPGARNLAELPLYWQNFVHQAHAKHHSVSQLAVARELEAHGVKFGAERDHLTLVFRSENDFIYFKLLFS